MAAVARVTQYHGSSGNTRFKLTKGVFLQKDVPGMIELLTAEDNSVAEEAFIHLLTLHLGDRNWEPIFFKKFEDASGAEALLQMLAAKPRLVEALNHRGRDWVNWESAAPYTAETGPAIVLIAARTKCERASALRTAIIRVMPLRCSPSTQSSVWRVHIQKCTG